MLKDYLISFGCGLLVIGGSLFLGYTQGTRNAEDKANISIGYLEKVNSKLLEQVKASETHTTKTRVKLPSGEIHEVTKTTTTRKTTNIENTSNKEVSEVQNKSRYRLTGSVNPLDLNHLDRVEISRRIGDSDISVQVGLSRSKDLTIGLGVEFGK